MASPALTDGRKRVWATSTRLLHWSLAIVTIVAWILHEGSDAVMTAHEWLGYLALALVTLRLVRGFIGPLNERFGEFLAGPGRTLSYTGTIFRNKEPRYLGHNPLGALMIVALILVIMVTGITGWMMTTETFWGVGWVIELHDVFGHLLFLLVLLHVLGVVFTSFRQGENLIGSMIHGMKQAKTRRHPEGAIDQ